MNDDSSIDEWVIRNSLGPSDSPPKKWVSKHTVNEQCWQVPEPRELDVDCWKGLLHKVPVISFNFIIWAGKVFVLLAEIKPWDQEDEDCDYKWHQ